MLEHYLWNSSIALLKRAIPKIPCHRGIFKESLKNLRNSRTMKLNQVLSYMVILDTFRQYSSNYTIFTNFRGHSLRIHLKYVHFQDLQAQEHILIPRYPAKYTKKESWYDYLLRTPLLESWLTEFCQLC